MGFSRQEYWSGLPLPPPGSLPDPEIKATFPSLAGGFFTTEPTVKPPSTCIEYNKIVTWTLGWKSKDILQPQVCHWIALAKALFIYCF